MAVCRKFSQSSLLILPHQRRRYQPVKLQPLHFHHSKQSMDTKKQTEVQQRRRLVNRRRWLRVRFRLLQH